MSEALSLVHMGGIASMRDRPKYLRLMQKMDSIFLEFHAEKNKK